MYGVVAAAAAIVVVLCSCYLRMGRSPHVICDPVLEGYNTSTNELNTEAQECIINASLMRPLPNMI